MRLSRVLHRPFCDWALFAGALLPLGFIRVGLTFLPFRIVRTIVDWLKSSSFTGRGAMREERSLWAVKAASRFVPGATCLTQSLTLEIILALQGIESLTRFGVARTPSGEFQAHAWVESRGAPLNRAEGVEQFIPLDRSGARTS